MIPLYSSLFWIIHLVLSIAVFGFAIRFWRYWSIRFVLAAVFINLAVLYAMNEIHQRDNGVNAPGTPVWLVVPVFTLGTFLSTVILALTSLGLLSFLPGGKRHGTRKDNLFVGVGILLVVVILAFLGYLSVVPQRPREALNPQKTFYPEKPISTFLRVQLKPKQPVFPDGSGTQFEVTFTNTSDRDISLVGLPLDGLRFRPYIWLQQSRDGRDLGYGTDLKIPKDRETLHSNESWTFNFPEQPRTRREEGGYYEDRWVLQPGDYDAFVAFWIERDGNYERVVSEPISFSVR